MEFVKRKASTAKNKFSVSNFEELKRTTTVVMEEISPHLILNWDQTGLRIVPSSSWTMDRRGSRRVQLTGVDDKRMCFVAV